jgi:hypothetical protein
LLGRQVQWRIGFWCSCVVMYVVIILQISLYYHFGVFQCVFLVFCLVQYVWRGFRICLNVFPYVQMLWQVVTVRGFLVNFDF